MAEHSSTGVETGALTHRSMARTSGDLALFQACFAKNSPRPRSIDSLTWQYFRNTTDRLFVDLAEPTGSGRLAAVYATLPGWMRIAGERRLVLQSLDTLTDADFRGRGLFVSLARRTFDRAAAEGAALIYGFPNGSSAPGFFKKLGWSPLDPVPFLIRPLRLSYVAERLRLAERLGAARAFVPDAPLVAPRWLRGRLLPRGARELTSAEPALTRLWERFRRGIGVAIDRDAEYLSWRIFEKPGEQYRVWVVEDARALRALCIHATKEKHGGRIGYVMELMHDRTLPGIAAASRLLGATIRSMADEGADSILAWSFGHSPSFPVYARHGFLPLPERFRPIELHLGVRAFDPAVRRVVDDRAQWYVSYLDSDTV